MATKRQRSPVADAPDKIAIPLLEPHEPYIQIRVAQRRATGGGELLSPTNKTPGSVGRRIYLQKQREMLHSNAHLIRSISHGVCAVGDTGAERQWTMWWCSIKQAGRGSLATNRCNAANPFGYNSPIDFAQHDIDAANQRHQIGNQPSDRYLL
jgi:hypothetical protein